MKKEYVFNEEINPDGISTQISFDSDDQVWEKGYFCTTDDGTWFEVYVNDEIKEYYPSIDLDDEDQTETFEGFHDLDLSNFEEYNQITFFVPKNEEVYTLEYLTEIFI